MSRTPASIVPFLANPSKSLRARVLSTICCSSRVRVFSLLRNKTKIVIVLILAALSLAWSAGDQGDARIRAILKETNVVEALRVTLRQQMAQEKKRHPEFTKSTWDAVEEAIASPQLEADLVGTWRGVYTPSELSQILAFVRTPAGKKFWHTQPALLSRMGAASGLTGFRVYGVLQRLHPEQYPQDSRSEAQMKALFEQMRSKKASK